MRRRSSGAWIREIIRVMASLGAGLALSAGCTSQCRAAIPGGVPIPLVDERAYTPRGSTRIGYYLISSSYRFQGDYNIAYNFDFVHGTMFYAFGDVNIDSLSNIYRNFLPDRFTGTFELGGRHIAGVKQLGLFIRHQSPHNIDRADRRQGSWEMVGARWIDVWRDHHFTVSTGKYLHPIIFDYIWDVDLQDEKQIGRLFGREVVVRADLHHVLESGSRSSVDDIWVEPAIRMVGRLWGFLATGYLHDVQVFGGRADFPIQVGLRVTW